jgi:hypothetical protein
MDIHIICHGLGNQLSQYAFFLNRGALGQHAHAYYAFAEHNGYELGRIFDLKEGLPWHLRFASFAFRLSRSKRYAARVASFLLSMLRIRIVVESETYGFDPALLKPWFGVRILFGGWHDSRYFKDAEQLVRSTYTFPDLEGGNAEIIRDIDASDSVSLHVRRGDYLKGKSAEMFGNIATLSYYRNAIARVVADGEQAGKVPRFFVFSDDINWCRDNLDIPNAVFVSGNSGRDSWKDMALMARCRTNIIANSTFSWWAAWLNQHPDKQVLCPARFANTEVPGESIYPPQWRRVSEVAPKSTDTVYRLSHRDV